jgi:flavin-dependent dehydrogenase
MGSPGPKVLRTDAFRGVPISPEARRREITIIGGSAAGLFLARLFAGSGMRVSVFEGAAELNPEPRTLIVTRRMRDILGPLEGSSVVNEIRRFELFTNGRSATVALRDPDLIVERSTLITGLAAQAAEAGADIVLGRRFVGLEADGSRLSVTTQKTSEGSTQVTHADVVVGADGTASRVAKSAGWPRQPSVSLLQATVKWPKDVPADTVRVWFVPEETPYFFWLIPESPTRGVLGLIAEDGAGVHDALDRFLAKQSLDPIELQAGRIPAYTRWTPVHKRVGKGDVYLVGDAAGQVKVTTVGGIVTGFKGALGVAESVLHGKPSREIGRLRRELNRHLLIRRVLHGFSQADYSKLVDLLNAPARTALGVHSRDDADKVLLSLVLRQPRFILLAIRGLLMRGGFRTPPAN